MSGQRIISKRPRIPLTTMINKPMTRRMRREEKPIIREIKRSINIWNFKSSEASVPAVSAEIWRNGLNKVRIKESIEKKSVMLEKPIRIFSIKTFQP